MTYSLELSTVVEFNVPFQHKYGYIRDKRSGVEVFLPSKEGQRHINLSAGHLFFQQPHKRERDQEAHLNYYTKNKYKLAPCGTAGRLLLTVNKS